MHVRDNADIQENETFKKKLLIISAFNTARMKGQGVQTPWTPPGSALIKDIKMTSAAAQHVTQIEAKIKPGTKGSLESARNSKVC